MLWPAFKIGWDYGTNMAVPDPRRPIPPLDAAALDRLALRYVERFATTRAKLSRYLSNKIRARGWAEGAASPDIDALAQKLVDLGYVDDRAFADAKAGAMTRRGLGARRVLDTLRHAGVGEADSLDVKPSLRANAVAAALTLARRKRIGPYADEQADRELREKQIGTLIRGGHGFALARVIATMAPGEDPDTVLADFDLG